MKLLNNPVLLGLKGKSFFAKDGALFGSLCIIYIWFIKYIYIWYKYIMAKAFFSYYQEGGISFNEHSF